MARLTGLGDGLNLAFFKMRLQWGGVFLGVRLLDRYVILVPHLEKECQDLLISDFAQEIQQI